VPLKGSFTYPGLVKMSFSQILAKKDKIPIHTGKQLVKAEFLYAVYEKQKRPLCSSTSLVEILFA
jgi:hypothetical protein